MSITVVSPGLQTTLQSSPRTGQRHLGVPANGAADPLSLAMANKLVGNAWDATAIEATLLGTVIRFESDCAFAITGARAEITLNGKVQAPHTTLFAQAGDELAIGGSQEGARMYIAVAGGLDADRVLGSTSTNLQAGFGGLHGRVLQAADVLEFTATEAAGLRTPKRFRLQMSTSWAVHACESVETQWLDADSLTKLFDSNWTICRRADRMGLRLEGPALQVDSDGRMPSAGVIPGTIQCPEDGAPYVLAADAGTVGGYPRIGQVARADRHILGQLRPGDRLRLLRREPDDAIAVLKAKIDYWQEWLPDITTILT